MWVLKQILILLVKLYRVTLSPLLGPNKCRYKPSCSEYAIDALQEWGPFTGTYMTIKRILRCHPWSTHPMHDPVPKKDEA